MEIQELRKKTGMSQSEFAKYFNIPKATLQDWEHKRRKPAPYIYEMMIRILNIEYFKEENKNANNTKY